MSDDTTFRRAWSWTRRHLGMLLCLFVVGQSGCECIGGDDDGNWRVPGSGDDSDDGDRDEEEWGDD